MPFVRDSLGTRRERRWRWCLTLVLALALLGGCATAPPRADPSPSASGASQQSPHPGVGTTWRVVALGDSVTSGSNCGCTPFPQLYVDDIAEVRGRPATVDNLGTGGMDSADLLQQLDDPGSSFATAVAGADIDLVTIGANDFVPQHDAVVNGKCLTDEKSDCMQDELENMRSNVSAILARIRQLRGHRPTALLVTGYWNVFEDGEVARSSYPDVGLAATQRLTRRVNAALREVAAGAGATYVDLYAPFNGPGAAGDITHLLAPDGDHPNADGQALIARALVAAGLTGLVS